MWTEELKEEHGDFSREISKEKAQRLMRQGWTIRCELSQSSLAPNGALGVATAHILLNEEEARSFGNPRLLAEARNPSGSSEPITRKYFRCDDD